MFDFVEGASPSPLADDAQAFCKECLGWDDAIKVAKPSGEIVIVGNGQADFLACDLNAVMGAVLRWLPLPARDLSLEYDGYCFVTHIKYRPGHYATSGPRFSHCHALLSASVRANRLLRDSE